MPSSKAKSDAPRHWQSGICDCCIHGKSSILCGCACIYSCFYRKKLRVQYALEEKPCADVMVHCCCEPCGLCQEYRELQAQGFNMAIGWHGSMDQRNHEVGTAPRMKQGMSRDR